MRIVPAIAFIIFFAACASKNDTPKKSPAQVAGKAWLGSWQRKLWQNEGSLDITAIRADSIAFTLSANSGGHTGDIEGWAIVKKNTAFYSEINDTDSCIIEFSLAADSVISIIVKSGNCFTAMGVSYDGKYIHEKYLPKEPPVTTLTELGIFTSAKQEDAFKILVGEDYDLFLSSTQLTSTDDDIDSLQAAVHSSGVRGLFTFMENIVMTDASGHIWAAVIDDNTVYYFTNAERYKDHLPNTIEKWRSNFKDYPVIYKSK